LPKQTLKNRLQDSGVPGDIMLGMPRVLLRGDRLALVENHQGIIEYAREILRIRTALGILCIHGDELTLSDMGQEDLLVGGEIRRIEYEC